MNDVPEDPRLAVLLDDYLRQVQAGTPPDREALGRQHPELAPYLDCLDGLEKMFPNVSQDTIAGPAVEPSLPGAVAAAFGSYELVGEVGRGGMGVVYKARQKGLDRLVAVKMILASHVASPEYVRRFQEEARAAAVLRHPHIVQIHEVGQIHGQHFFTMEYVEGSSLADRIRQGPLTPEEIARLLAKVARAVEHLHAHGIVHRDLKPSNILIDASGEPYVTDFGLAKVFTAGSDMTTTGAVLGTPSYMSPEQASGQHSQIGPASDIYSLGAVLYELLANRPPFREASPVETLLQVLNGEPALPHELNPRAPRALERICMKCLARTPHERYSSAQALADDLDHYLMGEPLEARPPGIGQRVWRWVRREPALASRLATLTTFLGIDAVIYGLGETSDFCLKMAALIVVWLLIAVVFQQFLKVPPKAGADALSQSASHSPSSGSSERLRVFVGHLKSGQWSVPARFVWGTLDTILLLAALLLANGVASPLVVGYPLLVAASGLWFRVRFVWFMTGLSLVSYSILVWDFYYRRWDELSKVFPTDFMRHVIFTLALVVMAGAIAYLVDRLRTLSTYCGQKL
jgi:serine/threonine-protein kinase